MERADGRKKREAVSGLAFTPSGAETQVEPAWLRDLPNFCFPMGPDAVQPKTYMAQEVGNMQLFAWLFGCLCGALLACRTQQVERDHRVTHTLAAGVHIWAAATKWCKADWFLPAVPGRCPQSWANSAFSSGPVRGRQISMEQPLLQGKRYTLSEHKALLQ